MNSPQFSFQDTAYVLFYKRVEASDLLLGDGHPDDDPGSPAGVTAGAGLRSELRKMVDTDNTLYVQVSDHWVCCLYSLRGVSSTAVSICVVQSETCKFYICVYMC